MPSLEEVMLLLTWSRSLSFCLSFALILISLAPDKAKADGNSCLYTTLASAQSIHAPLCDSSGNLKVNVVTGTGSFPTGAAGSPNAAVGSFQGVPGGYPVPISGTVTASGTIGPGTTSGSGSLTSGGSSVIVPVAGYTGMGFTVSGTWVGTITWLASADGGATYPFSPNTSAWIMGQGSSGYNFGSLTANDSVTMSLPVATHVKIYFSSYTSGTANITWTTGNLASTFSPVPVGDSDTSGFGGITLPYASFNFAYNGSLYDRIRKDVYTAGPLWTTNGGSTNATLAVGASTTIKSGAGRLASILITTIATSTGIITCYDNTAASGTIIAKTQLLAGAPAGSEIKPDRPFATGLTCASTTTIGPAATISYY